MIWNDRDLYTVERFGSSSPQLFIELPHGCIHIEEYERFTQNISELPENLVDFFLVNTDIGTPELGFEIARLIQEKVGVVVLRSRIPRTLIDCNRILSLNEEAYKEGKVTPGIPSYVPLDHHQWLKEIHQRYTEKSKELFEEVCAQGGYAMMLHSYAPRSVGIDSIDHQIVEKLHWAYQDKIYKTWPLRPQIDFIAKTQDNQWLGAKERILSIKQRMEADGLEVGISSTYPMHPATTAYMHTEKYPNQTLCIEIRRDLLMKKFRPFTQLDADPQQIQRFARLIGLDFFERNE
ncbi:MAG: hypothetical protein CL916_09000 [Deltaproteobacteria bacterium]|nr:hypothetical protein [Deltaproteobacteria bacterium]